MVDVDKEDGNDNADSDDNDVDMADALPLRLRDMIIADMQRLPIRTQYPHHRKTTQSR